MLEFGLPLVFYLISFFVSVVIGVYTFQNRQIRGVLTFSLYAFCQAQWTLGYIFELIASTLQEKIFWDNFQYLGSFLVPVNIFVFALTYTTKISMKRIVQLSLGLSLFPLIGTLLAFTNESHGLVASNYEIIANNPFNILHYDFGDMLGVLAIYSYVLSFAGIFLLFRHNSKVTGLFRIQLWLIIIGLVIPLVSSFSFIFDITLNGQRDFQPITFGLGNIFIAIGLFRYKIFNLVPVARERVLQSMNDAVIIVDNDQRIMDINPIAKEMLFKGVSPLGKFVNESLLWLAPHITTTNIETELQIWDGDKRTYYELMTNEILDDNQKRSGSLILIRDVTDKALALRAIEDARFQAELLADISDAMNSAQSEDDLLIAFSAVVVQYLPSRTALMYVDYEDETVVQLRTVALQDEHGENLPIESMSALMNFTPEQFPLVNKLLNTDTPLYIENIYKTDLFGEIELNVMNRAGYKAIIIAPLRTQERHEAFLVINWDNYQVFPQPLRTMIELLAPRLAENITARRASLQVEEAQRETELFYRLSQAINATVTYTQILDAFADVFGPFNFNTVLMVAENYDFATAKNGRVVATLQASEKTAVAVDILVPLLRTQTYENRLLHIEDTENSPLVDDEDSQMYKAFGIQSLLITDCVLGNRAIGRLNFSTSTLHRFTAFEQRLIRGLSDLTAAAIERSWLYLQAQDAQKETELFYRLSQSINATLTHTQILDAFADVFGPFNFVTNLIVAENYDFATASYAKVVAVLGKGEKTSRALDTIIPRWNPHTGIDRIIQINNIDEYTLAHPGEADVYANTGMKALLGIDCVLGNRIIGRIGFASNVPYNFTEFDRRLIGGLADLIAAALERARLYQEQVQIAEQLRAVDQMKSQFLASMSHELRTPLNAILNFTEFVSLGMLGQVNDKQKDALGKSLDSAKHLLALINDVLDMTKIEAGMMKLFIEDNIDLTQELNTILATSKTLLHDKPVVLIQDIDPDLPRLVGDKRRIRQILLNLMSNACKFTEKGSITLSVKKRHDELLFAVIDTGPGIAPQDQDVIFEPFRQTEHGIKHAGGTGLGLPITKKLVEAHGGKLWLESDKGQGASFYLTLPIHSETLISEMQLSLA
ncbi:MAG: histidine kinase N-terminal 7TM domain-containing protein [bacterium]|nr:histidine kinase N-terminal 7TM domain-containing protein [bacterium]